MKKVTSICFCGLFCALFFAISNLMPSVIVFGNVPLTMQIFAVALMAYLLDLRYALLTYATIVVMTLCGIPMMSSLSSGVYALIGPTAGYIAGWLLLMLMISLGKNVAKKARGDVPKTVAVISFTVLGLLLVYAAGSAWLTAYVNFQMGFSGFLSLFLSNITAFLLFDLIKVIAAYAVCKFLKKFI